MTTNEHEERVEMPDALRRRVWITNIEPCVDGGQFPIKRTVGEKVRARASIFSDGHEVLAAWLRYRTKGAKDWNEAVMRSHPNDVWTGEFSIDTLTPYEYSILAIIDRFASWKYALRKKHEAGQDVSVELLEGALLIEASAERARGPLHEEDRGRLLQWAAKLRSDAPMSERVALALSESVDLRMQRYIDRSGATESSVLLVDVARPRARFGAWYEMFPRSEGPDPSRSGTFREAEARLPEIAAMGFDVLYLPPIHPIGRSFRKGPNNTLQPGPGDPGSPWAVGAEEGGHKAVHPELGTLDDFRHFLETAAAHNLEIALDIAFQCAPDHPYVREHPDWFKRRPDGSIQYAENPPKKYQDIYPLDFECKDWRALWQELESVVLFWIEQGVRIFRVDNPHTKTVRFWQWLIGRVKETYPETIFLSEAFTRPAMMYTLAKIGFDQSYTYFTWRNTRWEIIQYFTELTQTGVKEFFRPNLFANTPDILPEYLQFGGRPAFMIRAVLAATLGATYGIYRGYELSENEAIPGKEEYLNSEKFQIRHRNWKQPGNLREYIARLNAIRRDNPALATNERLRFLHADNEQILFFCKTTEDLSNIILVAANLDPFHVHDTWLDVPLEEFGMGPNDSYQVHDLLGNSRYLWNGRRNYVKLDPQASPAQIFLLRRKVRTERDFDYFM